MTSFDTRLPTSSFSVMRASCLLSVTSTDVAADDDDDVDNGDDDNGDDEADIDRDVIVLVSSKFTVSPPTSGVVVGPPELSSSISPASDAGRGLSPSPSGRRRIGSGSDRRFESTSVAVSTSSDCSLALLSNVGVTVCAADFPIT